MNISRTFIEQGPLDLRTVLAYAESIALKVRRLEAQSGGSGNSLPLTGGILTGNITAPAFIRAGGLPTQFLKADGSVDSNTYLTTGTASSTYIPLSGTTALSGSIVPNTGSLNLGANGATTSFNYIFSNNLSSQSTATNLSLYAGLAKGLQISGTTRNVIIQDGGVFVDANYRLDVVGTTRLQGDVDVIGNLSPTNLTSGGTVSGIKLVTSSGNPGGALGITGTTAGKFNIPAYTHIDANTIASGIVNHGSIGQISVGTITATNTSVTYNNASTLYIGGSPVAGTNITITNPYSLFVNSGNSWFGGNISVADTFAFKFGTGFQYISNNNSINALIFGSNGGQNMVLRNGNLGLGTADPSKKFELSTAGDVGIRIYNTTANTWDIENKGLGTLDFVRGGTLMMRIDQIGRLGVKNANPSEVLDVTGNIKATKGVFGSAGGAAYALNVVETNASEVVASIENRSTNGYGVAINSYTNSNNYILNLSGNNGTSRMWVGSNGNIGLEGATTPNGVLQFGNTVKGRKIVLFESGNNDNQVYAFGINGGILRYQVPDPSADHVFYAGSSTTTSIELARVKGNMGFEAQGSAVFGNGVNSAQLVLRNKQAGVLTNDFQIVGNLASTYLGNYQNHGLNIVTNNISRIYVTGGGNIGFGTITPAKPVEIKSTIAESLRLNATNVSQQTSIGFAENGTLKLLLGKNTDNTFFLYDVVNTRDLMISSPTGNLLANPILGNFLIGGTTDTGQKFQVTGTTKFTGDVTIAANNSFEVTTSTNPTSIYVNGDGFVSIGGTSNDDWTLQVNGSCYTTGSSYIGGNIYQGVGSKHASSSVQFDSVTKGALLPRMTTTQKNAITSPAEGLIVYDLTLHEFCFYNGSAWRTITSS